MHGSLQARCQMCCDCLEATCKAGEGLLHNAAGCVFAMLAWRFEDSSPPLYSIPSQRFKQHEPRWGTLSVASGP